ncbi:MAG: NTP transferase domain-containing protein [Cohaesibacteraceae bacterium]|nr:NTP transferase domain-containing protein [Cohaesibacteraceae bacterium]
MNSDQKGIVGVIIAGGLSRRMKGQDKCLLPLANKPLINHAIDRLAPQFHWWLSIPTEIQKDLIQNCRRSKIP